MNSDIKSIVDFYKTSGLEELSKKAEEVSHANNRGGIFLRGLIEFSNFCSRDCLYCGIRKSNARVNRYRLPDDLIIKTVRKGFESGLLTFVLQSGEDLYYSAAVLTRLIEKIKNATGGKAALTLSCGIRKKEDYQRFKKAGADRYLLRFETSDPGLHIYLRSGITLESRLKALYDLKEADYEVGSGYMVGLPGETEEIRIQNALLCRELELDMVGIGPFIPHPDTPLKGTANPGLELTIRAVALVRLLLPRSNIPATTAAGSIDPQGREKILSSGANVLMPNITPLPYRKDYSLYPGKACIDEDGIKCISCLELRAKSGGKYILKDRGDSVSRTVRGGMVS